MTAAESSLSTAAVPTASSSAGQTAAAPVSSSAAARVIGDPLFVGLLGQSFQVHGLSGAVYNLISDRSLTLNSRFLFLSQGECPPFHTACWSHPGSYITAHGLLTAAGDRLLIAAGAAQQGFASVQLNGRELQWQDGNVTVGSISVRLHHRWSLQVRAGDWQLELHNSDGFINLASVRLLDWSALHSHGLLGQTWRRPDAAAALELRDVEGRIDDYLELGGDLLGQDFKFRVEQA